MTTTLITSTFKVLLGLLLIITISCGQSWPAGSSLSQNRSRLMGLLNAVRSQQNTGLPLLYFDTTLNNLAQTHSVDMVRRKYFKHNTPEGLTPQERARAQGFLAPVLQHIAKGKTVTQAHLKIMGQVDSYANTINRNWTRVGLGIFADKDNTLFVTILFSTRDFAAYPLTFLESYVFKTQLTQFIQSVNPNLTCEDKKLSSQVTSWLTQLGSSSQSFFEFIADQQGQSLPNMAIQIAQGQYSAEFAQNLINQNSFVTMNPVFTKYGFGFIVDKTGLAKVGVVFSC